MDTNPWKARLDRQVPEGNPLTLLGHISGATALQRPPLSPAGSELKILFLEKQFFCLLGLYLEGRDLHAFSVNESCLEFGPANSRDI